MIIDFDKSIFNSAYIPSLKANERYVHFYGGAGSGKSIFAAQKELIKSFTPGERILCIRKVQKTMKNSVFAVLKDMAAQWGLSDMFIFNKSDLSIKNTKSDTEFILSGLDDPEKIKSIQGITRIWVEEATELTQEDFQQLDLRLRGRDNLQFTFSYNPINEQHWIKKVFHDVKRDDTYILKTTYKDNRFIDKQYKAVLDNMAAVDENYHKIYALGNWGGQIKSLIYPKWELVDSFPKEYDMEFMGLDFGFTNDPTSLVHMVRQGDNLYCKELIYETGLTNRDISQRLLDLGVRLNYDEIFADSAEPKSIAELKRDRWNVKPVIKGKDSIIFGIDIVKRYNIKVVQGSTNLIKELQSYKWQDGVDGLINKPVDMFNHALDAVRYGCMMKLKPKSGAIVI